jgi:hypothetical protein
MVIAFEALKNPTPTDWIWAANIVKKKLDERNRFPTWLATVFEDLGNEVKHPAILQTLMAFHRKGAKLLTTNYDNI